MAMRPSLSTRWSAALRLYAEGAAFAQHFKSQRSGGGDGLHQADLDRIA
jgi:hypothetical protein